MVRLGRGVGGRQLRVPVGGQRIEQLHCRRSCHGLDFGARTDNSVHSSSSALSMTYAGATFSHLPHIDSNSLTKAVTAWMTAASAS
jgi:hypothetical protein